MNKKLQSRKERKRKEAALKKKYGKFYNAYRQLEPRLTAHLASEIITIAKDYDKEQTKHKRQLKKLQTKQPKLKKSYLKLDQEREQLEYDLNLSSPTWRRLNLSPEVLDGLTQGQIMWNLNQTRRKLGINGNKQRKVGDQLMGLESEIEELEKKVDK
mgnify:CR=1 FL=1